MSVVDGRSKIEDRGVDALNPNIQYSIFNILADNLRCTL
jgi:hypothetical protein